MLDEHDTYRRQGFGNPLDLPGAYGLLLVDFVNGFADPNVLGGGNIRTAISASIPVLAAARQRGWSIAHSRIVFADDGADANVFALKVPSLLTLHENNPASAIVPDLAPMAGELVVRKTTPSAFSGTTLSAWLSQRGVRTLCVAGCTTSGCVRASVVDAMSLGFRPVVLKDCVGDRAIAPHEASLFDMEQKYALLMGGTNALATLSA